MIKKPEEAVLKTVAWIKERASEAKARSLVVGISGGVDSALVGGLCARTGLPAVGVLMPCHSSPSSIKLGEAVIETFKLGRQYVDLADAFDSISTQVATREAPDRKTTGSLRSCLRAPTLDYVAKIHGGIVVGTGNRDEDEVTRYFHKRGDGAVDISPIAKYHKSEVYELARFLGVPAAVLNAVPSADLWGPDSGQADESELGITYPEIEWAMREAQVHGGGQLYGDVDAAKLRSALDRRRAQLTERQRAVLETLAAMEQASRHKATPNIPVFDARRILELDGPVDSRRA